MSPIAVYVFLLIIGGLAVACGIATEAWWERREEVDELTERVAGAEADYRAISTRQTDLLRELNRVSADHADAVRELGRTGAELARERHLRRTDVELPRRSLEREHERWADLLARAVPEDRAGRYVPTEAERALWDDLDRRLEGF